MMIYPGETATCEFKVPFDASEITKGTLSFWQDGKSVLSIDLTSSNVSTEDEETYVTATLSQAQSLKLKNDIMCYAQLNLILNSLSRVTSSPMGITVGRQSHPLPIL